MHAKKLMMILAVAGWSMTAAAQEDSATTTYKPVEYPQGFTSQLNVVYAKSGDWEGKMDLYLPPNSGKTTPVIINIHGGGWNKGVKESQSGFSIFFKNGFAVANIEYRLSGQATAPAAVEDTRCALIYLIKNSKALNIDVNRIVIMGSSAGGHLALMGGMLANDHRFDGNCSGVQNVHVGRLIELDVEDPARLDEMCRALLVNPLIEDYEIVAETSSPLARTSQSDVLEGTGSAE